MYRRAKCDQCGETSKDYVLVNCETCYEQHNVYKQLEVAKQNIIHIETDLLKFFKGIMNQIKDLDDVEILKKHLQ